MWSKNISLLKNFSFKIAEEFFKNHGVLSNQHSRGYKFFFENYIHDVWFDETSFVLKGKSYHSQKKNEKPHQMSIQFEMNTVNIIECHCSCEVGLSQSCHHLIGLAFFLNDLALRGAEVIEESIASTSKPMEWHKPRGTKVIPEAITSVAFYKPTNFSRKKRPIQFKLLTPSTSVKKTDGEGKTEVEDRRTLLRKRIQKLNKDVPLLNLMKKKDTMTVLNYQMAEVREDTDCLAVELPLFNSTICNILISLPQPNIEAPSFEESKELERNTRTQHCNKLWHEKRKFIFTSSIFGMLCKRSKPIDLEFFQNLWKEKDLGHIKPIQHGRKEENNARVLYENKTGYRVVACGLVIHPYAPHLGTSPDGIVVTPEGIGLLEIKCPYGEKSRCLSDALKMKNFFLREDENRDIVVNTTHNYYYQIQGQMLLTGVGWCDLCTYFKHSEEIIITRVNFDDDFSMKMYNDLTLLYEVYLSF